MPTPLASIGDPNIPISSRGRKRVSEDPEPVSMWGPPEPTEVTSI
jgi:hypothetical protein